MRSRLDPDRLADLQRVLDYQIDSGYLPSCSAALALNGELVWAGTAGPTTVDTRYSIFSSSKALVAAAVWQLIDENTIAVTTPVRDLIELGQQGRTPSETARVTLGHLLTHAAGLPNAHMPAEVWHDPIRRRSVYAGWSCTLPPGEWFAYHPVAAHWLLADIIEISDSMSFTDAIHRRVTEPLGLAPILGAAAAENTDPARGETTPEGARFRPPVVVGAPASSEDWIRVGMEAPKPDPAETAQPVDIVEELSTARAREVGVPGGGGVTTPSELALFYQGLLHNPARQWSDETLRLGTRTVVSGLREWTTGRDAWRTLGLAQAGDDGFAAFRGFGLKESSPRAFGHDGAGGQLAFADPQRGLSFAFTTDGMDLHAIRQWRRGRALVDAALRTVRGDS